VQYTGPAARSRNAWTSCRLMVLTSDDADEAFPALRSGAHRYLLKSSAPAETRKR
jgi:DNA-binding NarL/FixJ family response regulator